MPSTVLTYLALLMEDFQGTETLAAECPFKKDGAAFLHWPGGILPKGYTLTAGGWEAEVVFGIADAKSGRVTIHCELTRTQTMILLEDDAARQEFYAQLESEGWSEEPG